MEHDEVVYMRPDWLDLNQVQAVTASVFGVMPEALKAKTKKHIVTVPRQVCMAIYVKYLCMQQQMAAAYFGLDNHATVIHAIRTVQNSYETNRKFSLMVDKVLEELNIPKQEARIRMGLTVKNRREAAI